MTLRRRGYLEEAISSDAMARAEEAGLGRVVRALGLDPNHPPKPAPKRKCLRCGKMEVVVREVGADTDYNEMEERCRACKYTRTL